MKMTREILGLPIVSISTGDEVGKVKNILFNGDKGAVDFVVVETGNQIFSAKVIPTDKVLGIGKNALTIENDSAISDINKISDAVELVEKDIKVKGTKVLTKKGTLVGEIGDVCVNEENCCRITALEHVNSSSHDKLKLIPRDKVITFGKNLIIVEEDFEAFLLDTIVQINPNDELLTAKNPVDIEPQSKETYSFDTIESDSIIEAQEEAASSLEKTEEYNDLGTYETLSEQPVLSEQPDAANLFEQRQRQYLIGRRVTKTITDKNGNIIASDGMIINGEIIDQAKANDKLVELVMNNEA